MPLRVHYKRTRQAPLALFRTARGGQCRCRCLCPEFGRQKRNILRLHKTRLPMRLRGYNEHFQ